MLISLITAWIATVCAALTAIHYFRKKRGVISFSHRTHIILGIVLVVCGLLHGLFAGNAFGTSLDQAAVGEMLFSWNLGSICFLFAILLAITYILRKIFKKNWIILHRALTILLVWTLVLHICEVGITLPERLLSLNGSEQIESNPAEVSQTESSQNDNSLEEGTQTESNPEDSDLETSSISENLVGEDPIYFSNAVLKDGTYEGSAEGYQSEITVSVVVEGGAVTEINIIDENDTPQYMNRALGIVDTILDSQSLEVDAVSGATYSSKGIVDAVYNALQEAIVDGELAKTEIQITQGGHHKGPR